MRRWSQVENREADWISPHPRKTRKGGPATRSRRKLVSPAARGVSTEWPETES